MNDEIQCICRELDEGDNETIGGKGKGIHLLWQCGAQVPDSVVIPAAMSLESAIDAVLRYFRDDSEQKEYAVRSSASIEDGRVKSFAGQFLSFLRIRGRQQLIEHCERIRNLESMENSHIQGYAGNQCKGLLMHIVVQEFIDADCSGVLFTCDPVSGSRSHMVLEYVQGTSEHLMDGTSGGARVVIHRDDIATRGPTGILAGDKVIEKVITGALELEKKLAGCYDGSPLDFEWAARKGEILWLQVRPVTALRRKTSSTMAFIKEGEIPETKGDETHWTSINAREALPKVLTPLVRDMLVPFVEMSFLNMARLFGDQTSYKAVSSFDGRVFLNVTDLRKLISRFPIKNPDVMIESLLTGRASEKAVMKFSLSLIPAVLSLIWKDLNLGRDFDAYIRKEEKVWKYPGSAELHDMTVEEIKSRMRLSLDSYESFTLHLMGSMRYMNVYALLGDICKKHDMSPSDLVQGSGTPLFASSALYLRDLCCALGDQSHLLFDDRGDVREDWEERLEKEPSLDRFKKEYHRYIEKFGHLGEGSMDIYLNNNREEPEKVLKLLAGVLKSGDTMSSRDYLERLSAKRRQALSCLRGKLTFLEKVKLGIVIKLMLDSVHFRENIKFYFSRRADIFKVYLMELADRLVVKGHIYDVDDIFFLALDEVMSLDIAAPADALKERIRERKQHHHMLQSLPCPLHRVEGPGGTVLYFPEKREHGTTFSGTGASAGKATGRARIIVDLNEADRLSPGDIIVTTATAPSWTPLFSLAGAVVVEIGTMLSHGAVVAREIGIPAVVGVAGAVEALRDGDLLAVDGGAGTVVVLERKHA